MKKTLLITCSVMMFGMAYGQNILFDNGPMVNSPGAGAGGADVSNLHDGISTYGFNHNEATGFLVAEDFTVPAAGWTVDSMIFFAYQTGSTTGSSTINSVKMGIYDASPATGANIIYGDISTSSLINTYWSGIYRTTETALTDVQRPIMRNVVETPGCILTAGTYFVSWQTGGSLPSGPWAPPINIDGVINTGDGLQYTPTTFTWGGLQDTNATTGTGTGGFQGLPFLVYGHLTTIGIDENQIRDISVSKIFPVPTNDNININLTSVKDGTILLSLKDYLGREIFTQEKQVVHGNNKINVSVSGQQAGIYILCLRSESTMITSKIIKD